MSVAISQQLAAATSILASVKPTEIIYETLKRILKNSNTKGAIIISSSGYSYNLKPGTINIKNTIPETLDLRDLDHIYNDIYMDQFDYLYGYKDGRDYIHDFDKIYRDHILYGDSGSQSANHYSRFP